MAKRSRKVAEAAASQPQTDNTIGTTEKSSELADKGIEFDPEKLESQSGTPTDTMQLETSTPRITKEPVMPKIGDKLPDPRSVDLISMTNDPSGPKMRLLRSNRNHETWIQFDENPGKTITDPIKAAGYRWEPRAEVNDRNGAWVKPLQQGREIASMLEAERLFKEAGNQFRKLKGLEPVGMSGHGAG